LQCHSNAARRAAQKRRARGVEASMNHRDLETMIYETIAAQGKRYQ